MKMNLNEAEKVLGDNGYAIKFSDMETKAENQMEKIVYLANTLSNVVEYFMDSEGDFDIIKVYAYGFEVKNKTNESTAKIGLLFDKNVDIPKIGVELDGELVYTTTGNTAGGLFRMITNLFKKEN